MYSNCFRCHTTDINSQFSPKHAQHTGHAPNMQSRNHFLDQRTPQSSEPNSPTNSSPPTPTCHECGTSFNNPEALALHVRLHTGDSSLVTDLCVLTASLQNSAFPHHHHHHHHPALHHPSQTKVSAPQPKPKNHICPHCNKPFSARHGLLQHNKRHPDGSCNIRSHICNICNKSFFQKNHLMLHQRQHLVVDGSAASDARNHGGGANHVVVQQQQQQQQQPDNRMMMQQHQKPPHQMVVDTGGGGGAAPVVDNNNPGPNSTLTNTT